LHDHSVTEDVRRKRHEALRTLGQCYAAKSAADVGAALEELTNKVVIMNRAEPDASASAV
jgi:hypothetical protein